MSDFTHFLAHSEVAKEEVRYSLIDTHTHFDAPVFDHDRLLQAQSAYRNGVEHLVLVGYLYRHFDRLYDVSNWLESHTQPQSALPDAHSLTANTAAESTRKTQADQIPKAHVALGLHPFYIQQHTDEHLTLLAKRLNETRPIAIGEIGLDTFTPEMREPENFIKQQRFFMVQLDMAVTHQLPVMLHIRKAHADALAILKKHDYDAKKLGGIAHSFSGGEQEAKAFVKLGFKLGVTGQVTNPNAKKLRRAIQAVVAEYGIGCLVIETDCPDMTPISCQNNYENQFDLAHNMSQSSDDEWQKQDSSYDRNVPANLPWVLESLSELLSTDQALLAHQLWKNSRDSLGQSWSSPLVDVGRTITT